jgi:DeoR family fructose operon transcriptional repressor
VIKEAGLPIPPYSQIRDANMPQKSWIAAAAAEFLPKTGRVFINAGSTTYQLVLRIQERHKIEVATNSPEIALYLASNALVEVDLVGGRMVRDSLETDGVLSADALARLYWDISFLGISALDTDHGITSINLSCAMLEQQVMRSSRKVIGLCDSSKLGRFGRAKAGEVALIDVLITDQGAQPAMIAAIEAEGVQVITARPMPDVPAT